MTAGTFNRGAIREWLDFTPRTWRWPTTVNGEAYHAVEASRNGLAWYRWNHKFDGPAGGEGGFELLASQTSSAFLRSGPPIETPSEIADDLRAWLVASS